MSKVFISFASADREFAKDVATGLQAAGHQPFIEDPVPGQPWRDVLAQRLRDADATVIVISPATNSQFVLTEAGAAMAYAQSGGRMVVVPVVLEGAPIPAPLADLQAIIAKTRDAGVVVAQIARALDASLGRQAAEDQARQETQVRLNTQAADFVQKSIAGLDKRMSRDRLLAYLFYFLGILSLGGGVTYSLWRVHEFLSGATGVANDWVRFATFAVLSAIVIGLLVAVAKYAFLLGKSFMAEALRNADRIHAISFGQFYLSAFGALADWKEAKEVFQHWNIDRGSAFHGQDVTQIDPRLFDTAVEIAKALASSKKDDKK